MADCPPTHHEVMIEVAVCLPAELALMPPSHLTLAVEGTLRSMFVRRRLEKQFEKQQFNIDP